MKALVVLCLFLHVVCSCVPTTTSWNRELPLKVRVSGDEFRWHLRYPGADGVLDTADDITAWRHLHLPSNRTVQVELTSRDYVYTVYYPHIELLEAAVPNDPYMIELETGKPQTLEMLGAQMCNYTHVDLIAELVVMSPHDFEAWLKKKEE
jgi:cytochrome c oxidase subunit 2